jgi:uncharacterized protein (TIGR00730 family)
MDLSGHSIAVFCGSSDGRTPSFRDSAAELGRELAARQAELVYGGASVGLMRIVADAALAAGGRVVGVIPKHLVDREVAHATLSELLVVETMHLRKAAMSERASGYVALPGGYGTYEELLEVTTWKQLGLHNKPIVLLNLEGYYDPLLAQVDMAIKHGFMRPELRRYLIETRRVSEALAALEAYDAPPSADGKWI